MQVWQSVTFEHPRDLLELAPVCEEAGFEGIMLADHLFAPEHFSSRYPYGESGEAPFDGLTPFPEVFATTAALAQVTTTLRFLVNVYVLPPRHPIEVAKDVSAAATLSENRAVLGVGAGWLREEFEIMGVPFERRGRRMDEQIPIIRRLLSGDVVETREEFYRFEALRLSPVPTEKVPLWVGGMNPAALRRAGQHGDGWWSAPVTFDESIELLGELRRQRERFGRESDPFDCLIGLTEVLSTEQTARLAELGMTGVTSWPLVSQLPSDCTIEEKKARIRELGETLVAPLEK
ncbi:MAG: TIGR03619 family F420-dependent LLM class oxidoreductase [Deltaproteobacteria bacterium]|nr:TIGR03619 family F420-dependent LLM class oxidoreductase [Deltaproteobacteria bacterium]